MKILWKSQVNEIVFALKQAIEDSEATLEITGGCDHSVGICACDEIANLARMKRIVKQLEAKTNG
jgi:hypothetical protein